LSAVGEALGLVARDPPVFHLVGDRKRGRNTKTTHEFV
jgi:hypothetical protein